MADTRELINGYDAEMTVTAESLPAPTGDFPPTRALVNGYDATVVSNADGGGVIDNTTEPNVPYKLGTSFENSNISQDPDGKIRFTTEILAEQGINTTPGTVTFGDGLDVKASGPQQINSSKVTGINYQLPYQEIDKTGTKPTFQVDAGVEIVKEVRQPVFDTVLTTDTPFNLLSVSNEIVNAIYLKTGTTVTNLRYQAKSVTTGEIIDSFPDKFSYANDAGVTLTGAATHKLDLYYNNLSTPNRFLGGQTIEVTMRWDTGDVLGNSSNVPYYEYDYQVFEFTDLISENDSVTKLSDITSVGSGDIITTVERDKLDELPYPNYGAGYFAAKESTYITTANVFQKMAAVYTPTLEKNVEWDVANTRWKYTGDAGFISIFATFTGGHDDDETDIVTWEFRINGNQLDIPKKVATIERYDTMSVSMMAPAVAVSTNDYIEIWCTINKNTENVETSNMNLLIR